MILWPIPDWVLERLGPAWELADDAELADAVAADLWVLAGLPGHAAPARAWVEVVRWLAAYPGATSGLLIRRSEGSGGGGPGSAGAKGRPAPTGEVHVPLGVLMAQMAADERGGLL